MLDREILYLCDTIVLACTILDIALLFKTGQIAFQFTNNFGNIGVYPWWNTSESIQLSILTTVRPSVVNVGVGLK
jgi:hypothetical protein